MKSSLKIAAAMAGAALLVALGVTVSFWALNEIDNATTSRRQARTVIIRADDLLWNLIAAENAQRGFLLTGDEAFLTPYLAVQAEVTAQLTALRAMALSEPARRSLDTLSPLVADKLAEIAHLIESRRSPALTAAPATGGDRLGRRLLETIRAEMVAFIRIEENEFAQHEAQFQANLRRLFGLMATASVLTLLLALAFAYFIYRETQHRLRRGVLLETQHLLGQQQETNRQLQEANVTLQVSEERLAVTLHSIGDGVIATDAAGNVTLLNPLAERLTGWKQAEAAGHPASEVFHIVHPDSRQPAKLPLDETLQCGTIQGLVNHTLLLARDGGECAIADSCAPIRNREGQVVGAVLVFRDVTQEDAARLELRDSTALIQTILNTVGDGIITLQASGGIIARTNPAVERMFGYAAGELIGRNFDQLIPELNQTDSAGTLAYYSASAEAQAAGLGREVVGRRHDGTTFPLEITLGEMSLGGVRFFTGILRDATARKQIEVEREQLAQRLREQQFYTRSLFEANIDALMTTDPAGIITDVNKQMEALTGSTRDELIGAPFSSCFTEPARAENSIRQVLSERKLTNYELTARARDGSETVVSYNATTFYDRERRLQGMFAAARDITERKHADEALRRALAELNEANTHLAHSSRLKDEFLANMSHELRTPLNAVLGLSEVLLEQTAGPLTPRQIKSVTTISTSGQHLLSLINDILDLSKIEAGKLILNPSVVEVAEFCQSCLAFVRTQALHKQVDVAFEDDGRVSAFAADPKRLKQVIVNLLTNAVKFTPPGGRIGLVVAAPTGEDCLRFTIWDTGIGIAPADAARLFHAFTQIDSGLSRAQEGTGLGLALVARLVGLHGGKVTLESTPGAGSRFTVTLPRIALPAPPGAAPSAAVAATPRPHYQHALIIEDDAVSGAMLAGFLTELGLSSVVSKQGEDAIEVVRRAHPDVILLDILLPGESGWVVLAKLKAQPDTRNIPVVVVSFVDEPEKSRALGALAHLTKPVSRAQLEKLLRPAATAPTAPAAPNGDPSAPGPLILLAEDNAASVEALGDYLGDKGYALCYATNGRLAVDLARERRPALILMDVQMPILDGLAATREIRADAQIGAIPIIALTALAMPGDRERCLAAGATDYMSKPVNLKALAARVGKLTGMRSNS